MPRTDKRDLRRKVLDAALELVASGGIDELSIREVARRAGVTHQAPYHHFRDRAAILSAIAEEGFTMLRDRMIAEIEAAPLSADARFEACGLGYFRFAIEHPAHFRIMFRSESHAPRSEAIQRAAGDAMRVLLRCVLSAQTAGLAPAGDPWPLVMTSWSAAHGVSALWVDGALSRSLGGPGYDAEQACAMVAHTLARLLKAATVKSKRRSRRARR